MPRTKSAPRKVASKKKINAAPAKRGSDRWLFYEDASGGRRWRRLAVNGRIVGASSESYASWTGCLDNAARNGFVDTAERIKRDCGYQGA